METDVGRTKKKIQVVPKAQRAFQKKLGENQLPSDLVTKAHENFGKFVISNKLVDATDDQFCKILEAQFSYSREHDSKSKDGCTYLRWTVFNNISSMFFFGDGLLCLVNGCYLQIVDKLLTEPICSSFNLLSRHVTAGVSGVDDQYACVKIVSGCPLSPTLAYVTEDSSIIYLLTFPKMTCVAMMKSHTTDGSYIGLDFGLGEYLYALRGHPDCSVEIWHTGSLSLLTLIPGAHYSNKLVVRTSLISNDLMILDRDSQHVVMWALHSTTPADLFVCPRVIQVPQKLDAQLVDVAFSFDGDLYLLSENGHIHLVRENNDTIACCLVENNKIYNRLLESRSKDNMKQNCIWESLYWLNDSVFFRSLSQNLLAKYKAVSRVKFELLDTYTIDGEAHIAVNSRSGVFKANLTSDLLTLAVWDGSGLRITKPKSRKLSETRILPGKISDVSVLSGHAILVEKRCIRFIKIEDGSLVNILPMHQDLHKLLVHPNSKFFVVSGRQNGSLFLFEMNENEVKFIEKFLVLDRPIEIMTFSLRGDALVVGSKSGNVSLFLGEGDGLIHPVTTASTKLEINSLSFMHTEDDSILLAAASNKSEGSCEVHFFNVPTLNHMGIVGVTEQLHHIAESRLTNVIYATSQSGLSAFSFSFYSRKGSIYLRKTKKTKCYDQTCWRRLLCNTNFYVIYGTDGSLDVFTQEDDSQRIYFSKTESSNGFICMSICPNLKFMVGLQQSGVLLCRSIKHRSRVNKKFEDTPSSASRCHFEYFDEGEGTFRHWTSSLFKASLSQETDNLRNEGLAYKFSQRHLIGIMAAITENVASLELFMTSLNPSYQEELRKSFQHHVSTLGLRAIKYRNLKKLNQKQMKEIVQVTEEIINVMDSYSKSYIDVFERQTVSSLNVEDRKEYSPTMMKGSNELVHNFCSSVASTYQEETVDHVLLYCTDNITISTGFDKYTSPRWLRNAGPGAEVVSVTAHSRKKKDFDGDERPKFDLNRKITEAVTHLSSYFLKKRELEEHCNFLEVLTNEKDNATEASLPQMKIVDSTKPSAECFQVEEDNAVEVFANLEQSVASSQGSSGNPNIIFDASDDGSEEECISSESMSSGASYEMETSGEKQRGPGELSGYLIKLLERKEAKKTEKLELKDGMLRYHHHLPENIKAFIRKFHGSSSHTFLHVFPLYFCSDEMESILINHIQFFYSHYFVEALRERFNSTFEDSKADDLSILEEEKERSLVSKQEDADVEDEKKGELDHDADSEEEVIFFIEPLKPATPLMTAVNLSDLKMNEDMMQRIEICPAAWRESEKLNILFEWMEESKELSIECKPSLEALPSGKDITSKHLSRSMHQVVESIMERRTEPDHEIPFHKLPASSSASDVFLQFKWPEIPPSDVIVPTLGYDMSQESSPVLLLLSEWEKFAVANRQNQHLSYDFFKRRKWCIRSQILSETLQLALKNYRAQMIKKLLDDTAMVRFFVNGVTEYLEMLNQTSSQVLVLFREILQIYNDFKQPLNELNHMKKVLNHICRKYNVLGLSHHVERMDSFELEIQDAGSAEFLEHIIRTQMLFLRNTDSIQVFNALKNDHSKHFGFSAILARNRFSLWDIYFSWKRESESSGEETIQEETVFSKNFRDDIFQLATDFHLTAITLQLTVRSLLLRLKILHEAAVNIKKQYMQYNHYSLKLTLLENTLESCVKEWITFEREFLTFKTADLFKSSATQDISLLSTLVPTDYIGWELPLIASRADKILLRRVKKQKINQQNKTPANSFAARTQRSDGTKKAARTVRWKSRCTGKSYGPLERGAHRLSASDEEIHNRLRRRQSKATNPRAQLDWDAPQNTIRTSSSHRGKCCFDSFLDEFVQHVEEVGEKGAQDEMKIPDLASALQGEELEMSHWNKSPATDLSDSDKVMFCENPIFTNIDHLSHQDHLIRLLQNEYHDKLMNLIKSKDEFRKYKAEISNVKTKMMNLMEEYATIKKYIVSREETHLVTNLLTISDSLKENKIHHETQSLKLNAEVERSLRLIKKGKFEATEWLMSKLASSKDPNKSSDEEQASKKSSSVSEQLKSSCRSDHRETSSASIVNLTNEAEKEVSWEASNYRSTAHGSELKVETTKKLDTVFAMTSLLRGEKVLYSFCRTHCKATPPFCCLEEIFLPRSETSGAAEPMAKLETEFINEDLEKWKNTFINEELFDILSGLKTTPQMAECDFLSHNEEHSEIESSSHQSSLKIEATLGSWSDSEPEEALDSTTLSMQDKLDSVVENLMENKSEIIRHLTHKYIMEKCGELFVDIHNEQIEEGVVEEIEYLKLMRRTAESELTEHHQDLMSLNQECSSRIPVAKEEANKKILSLYEARLRSETLRDIRNLKDHIKEKQTSIAKLEEELERQKMRKYPTFDL